LAQGYPHVANHGVLSQTGSSQAKRFMQIQQYQIIKGKQFGYLEDQNQIEMRPSSHGHNYFPAPGDYRASDFQSDRRLYAVNANPVQAVNAAGDPQRQPLG